MSELIIYISDNLRSWAEQQMVWLKQLEDTLNRLAVIFLETAEQRTKRREAVPMRFWRLNMNQVIRSNGFPLLTHAGKVSHTQMERTTTVRYLNYDQRRRQEKARQADMQDDVVPQALETILKKRPKT